MRVYVYTDDIWGISFEEELRSSPGADRKPLFEFDLRSDDIPPKEIMEMLQLFMGDVTNDVERLETAVRMVEKHW